jgi:uncharacterized protein YecE (DUF72 family)
VTPALERLLARKIYLGTSSWKYPGWQSFLYTKKYKTKKSFNEECLLEYAEHFPAVGVDHTYYAWPSETQFRRYSTQTPDHFRFCLKATETISVLKYPKLPRYGKLAGQVNQHFLDAALFKERFLRPLDSVSEKLGPIFIEFSQFYPGSFTSGRAFMGQLDAFLKLLSTETSFQFAVEIRNQAWLTTEYLEMLASHGVAHVHNSWTRMPSLAEQLERTKNIAFPSMVSRVLLQPGTQYEEAVEAFAPYNEIQSAQPALRSSTSELVRRALSLKIPAYVFVNNRAEGCAPKTIEAIVKILESRPEDGPV